MKRERHTYLTLQTVEAARQDWLDRISAEGRELATERVPLSAALHRVLADSHGVLTGPLGWEGRDPDRVLRTARDLPSGSPARSTGLSWPMPPASARPG